MDAVIDENSDKEDNMGSNIDSTGTADNYVNKKNCVQNQAGTLNSSSKTVMESSI